MTNLITITSDLIKNEDVLNKLSTKSKTLIKSYVESYVEYFDKTHIQIVRVNDKLYFSGEDILKILEYSTASGNVTTLNKINLDNYKRLNQILTDEEIQNFRFNGFELGKKYINERELHILILKSHKKDVEKFQEFILDLIDQAEKNTKTEKNNIISDMILELNNKINAMMLSQSELKDQILQLCK